MEKKKQYQLQEGDTIFLLPDTFPLILIRSIQVNKSNRLNT